jgi:hypothetical protein
MSCISVPCPDYDAEGPTAAQPAPLRLNRTPFKAHRPGADLSDMEVSSLAASITSQYDTSLHNERSVLVLKKTQDAAKAQGQALVDLVKASTQQTGRIINVYA